MENIWFAPPTIRRAGQARMPVLPWFISALLAFLLRRINFTWTTHRRWRHIDSRCYRFGMRLRVCWTFISARWRWQRYLFQFRFRIRCRCRCVVFVSCLCRIFADLSAFGLEFTLALTEKLLHIFRHSRRLIEFFLRFAFQEVLHTSNEHREGAVSASHVIAEWFFPARVTHPNAGHVSWRVSDKPNVGVIVDCAGLASYWNTERTCFSCSSKLNNATHHRHHRQSYVGIHNLVSCLFPLLEHSAVAIKHATHEVRLNANAFVWKR